MRIVSVASEALGVVEVIGMGFEVVARGLGVEET